MTTRRTYGQACPVALTLDLVGERWTLLIVRDLMFGPLRFTDLSVGLPGLAPNLLSERLRILIERGILERAELPPPAARTVYVLTTRGRELAPIVHELARFGVGDWTDPDGVPPPPRLLRGALLALMTPEVLSPSGWSAAIELPGGTIVVTVSVAKIGVPALRRLQLSATTATTTTAPATTALATTAPDVVVHTTLGTLLAMRRGTRTRAAAEAEGHIRITGSADAAEQVARLLGWT